ncbi:MAG TPA: cytochrome P450, partial [Solirubrobacteraceae bacterium]|nr:cytochrome P450 [Solirubrobacteraceae bacterium]
MSSALKLQMPQVQPKQNTRASKTPPMMRGSVLLRTLRFTFDPDGFFWDAHRRYGDVFVLRVLGQEWLAIAHPDAVREVFSHGPDELNSGEANQALTPVLGTRNLLLLDGEEHLHRRRIVLPPFHGERMRAYEQTIRAAISKQIAQWPLGEPAAALPRMQALTFEVIMRCVFGVEEGERVGELGKALQGMI